jgi:hypothetical protein
MRNKSIGEIREKAETSPYENMKTFQRKNLKISEIFKQQKLIKIQNKRSRTFEVKNGPAVVRIIWGLIFFYSRLSTLFGI